MALRIERELCDSLKKLLCNSKFRLKDLYEWSSKPVTPREGEVAVDVEMFGTTWYCCVPASVDKRKVVS